jgi:hypothetical protein
MLTLKRLLSLAICAAIFISAIAACGEKIDDADRDTETAAAEVTAETTTVYRDENIPADLDLGGETINIWYFTQCSSSTESFIDMKGEQSGEVVDDALYWRNLSVEEQLNVKLNFYDCGFDAVMTGTEMRKLIMSDSTDYDLYNIVQWTGASFVTEGLFMNMADAPYMNIDEPWWATEYIREMGVGKSRIFLLCGDIDIDMIRCIGCMYFNKQLYENYFGNPEDQYNQVLDGKWTMDVISQNAVIVYSDLDGDNKVSKTDQFGMMLNNYNNVDVLFYGLGIRVTGRDADGNPELILNNERNFGAMQTYHQTVKKTVGVRLGEPLFNTNSFSEGRSLYLVGFLYISEMLRDMTQDYGIIPAPKYNEEQENYCSVVQDIVTLQCIPNNCRKLEQVSAVLELMAFESYRSVTPAYYEVALKTKYTRDNISSQIIDILHDTAMTDIAYVFADAFNGLGFTGRGMIQSGSSNLSSWYAVNEKGALTKMQILIDAYGEL